MMRLEKPQVLTKTFFFLSPRSSNVPILQQPKYLNEEEVSDFRAFASLAVINLSFHLQLLAT
jgi:hypothetical protein